MIGIDGEHALERENRARDVAGIERGYAEHVVELGIPGALFLSGLNTSNALLASCFAISSRA